MTAAAGRLLRAIATRLAARADKLDQPEVDRLSELADSLGASWLELGEYVHDLASGTASDVNNSGLAGQVAYLVREAGPAEAERMIREASGEPDDELAEDEAAASGQDPARQAGRRGVTPG